MASSQVDMSSEEHMQTVLERQLNGLRSEDRGRLKIATYATKLDRTILCFSSVCAIIAGALNPLVPVIYGLLVGVFNGFATGSVDAAELRSKISTFSLYYVYLSIGLFVFTYLATVGFYYSGERITRAFRIAYLSAIIRQNMAFFDVLRPGEISNRIMSDMGILQEAITSKASTMLSAIATFCAAFIIAFVMYWKTALILTPFFVAMLLMFSVGGAYTVRHQKQSRESGLGMQNFVRQRYSLSLGQAAQAERKAQNMVAGLVASMNAMPCLIYALSFWAGSIFLVKGEMSVTDITTTTLAVTIGVFAIIRIAPSLQALTSGVAITGSLLETIARRSPQDPLVADGDKLTNVVGDILFDQVDLVYPSRSQAKVLDRVTLKFAADKKTAIVGPSGGGKSSIIGLIERFYEPTHGAITIDGQDIQAFNLRWLRQQIGLVDQDPILLDVSILDNIYYGCSNVNDAASESARLEKVVDAAKKAYAHDFIMALPEGYQTRVGEKGLQLSGGQRQRIAIARALVRDPKILLLDEATSALDTSSEKAVQAAIDAAAEQRTTVVIAHRLSTIKNADSIVVLAQGKVVDQGTHVELMARNGLYAELIEKQQIKENGQDASNSLHTYDEGIIMLNDSLDHGSNSDDEKNGASVTARVVETPNDTSYNPSARGALSFIFFMSRPDWKLLLIGLACAILAGLEIPVQSIFFAKLLTITGLPQAQYSQLRHGVNLWTGLYVALAGAGFILWLGLGITLSCATQKLSQRVREICCHRITVQDMAFFDQSKNSPSALSSVLSKSTDDLAGMGGPVLGGILTFISTIVGGIVVSLAIGWKLALVCTATIPVVVACGWLRLQVLAAFDARIRQSGVDSAAYAGQIVRSMRTVASLGLEEQALMLYDGFLAKRAAKSLQSILIASGLYAASQSVVYLCAALAFWYGGTLIANREYSDFQVYVCFVCLISGSQIAGSIFTFAPDAGKAMHAAQDLQYIVQLNDPENEVQWRPAESGILEHKRTEHELLHGLEPCQVAFKNVSFSYPSRPDTCALDNFTITVEPGQTLALEPVVFSGTMRENIAVDLVGQVSDDDILAACRQANILDFVHSLPDGLSSIVGTGGSMLSGGQKQRITIARAFLRKSKLLLLDEATSALDSESEAIVQAAIDAVKKNRTTIMVAHRLSTVMNADIICVMREGSIVEIGNSKQLMARRGLFWEMMIEGQQAKVYNSDKSIGACEENLGLALTVCRTQMDAPRKTTPYISYKARIGAYTTFGTSIRHPMETEFIVVRREKPKPRRGTMFKSEVTNEIHLQNYPCQSSPLPSSSSKPSIGTSPLNFTPGFTSLKMSSGIQDLLSPAEPLPIQSRDFVVWQKQQGQTGEHQRQVEYWVKQLEGSHPARFLCDKPRQTIPSGAAEKQQVELSGSLYRDLQDFCKVHEVTPFTVLLTAFRTTHYRLTGVDDATVGTLKESRNGQRPEGMIDFLANLQCIRIRIEDDQSFEQLVRQVHRTTADAHANQDVPFEKIVSELPIDIRDGSTNPVVQLVFSLHSKKDLGRSTFDSLEMEQLSVVPGSRLDLEFHLFQEAECIRGTVLFATELYHQRTISGMVAVFYEVLKRGLEEPQTPVASLHLTDGSSMLREMGLLEIKRTMYARDSSVVEAFQRQALASPSVVAVKDSAGELTYAQLDQRSGRLANWLTQAGIPAETLIGVLAPRSCQTIVAFLGILKANLAYMPLDIRLPKSRIEAILSAVPGHKLLLLGQDVPAPAIQAADVEFLSIADILHRSSQADRACNGLAAASVAPSATSLAYVMFTSGSTGKPKGVMVEHRGILRAADVLSRIWGAVPVAHMTNIAFDTSTSEIYTPLLNGGTIICIDDMTALDGVRLGDLFNRERVEVAVFPPAFLKECLVASPTTIQALRVLFTAGDRLDAQDASKILQLVKGGVYNSYGPTENSVLSTLYRILPEERCVNGVPIGRAVSNSGAYVMDMQQRLVPIGVLGELVVTGDGVARGYTDPERDRDRFVRVVIDGVSVKAYRTGDYVRYRPMDGQLEFFGRMDYQVKIRGHRIELGEVEHALLAYESVDDAVTVVRDVEGQEPELVSFITISDGQGFSEWETVDSNSEQGQVETWREHFDVTAYAGIDNIDPSKLGRDFVGWTSMYDGSEIDRNEMEEWLDDTITAILDGGEPRNVLEVGTGSGMILFNLPKSLQSYVGLELAEQAATFANKAAQSVPSLRGKVEVRVGTVTDVSRTDRLNSPDLVVINSTAQYFPTPEYLLKAIEDLLRLDSVERLFFGDVRSYALYREFQVTQALHITSTATPGAIRQNMTAIERAEEELLIDPAFFTALETRLPDLVDHVEILPKRMRATNELSCYRYAAVIYRKHQKEWSQPIYQVDEGQWIDFVSHQLDRQSLLQLLESLPITAVAAVSNIPYSKTIFERCVLKSLDSAADEKLDGNDWVRSCHEAARSTSSLSVVDLHEVAHLANFSVEVSWARQASQSGGLDAVFHRYTPRIAGARVLFRFPTDHHGRAFHSLTNRPLQQRLKQRVEEQLRNKLKVKLPSYMVPSVIRVLDKMPINDNGKVDRRALTKSAHIVKANRSSAARMLPRNDVERALCEEFTSVLGEEVGITDSFYDLGGHSLQAARLVSRINRRLMCRLYVFDLLNSPTPAALGDIIPTRSTEGLSDEPTWHFEHHRRLHSRLTVVLIHGLWGQGSIFSPLIPFLDDIFDVLVIHDPYFGRSDGPKTIPRWAELYLNHVEKQISPGHGLIFGGYSLGGLIAYEMASLWRVRHGEYPASLVLLDAATYTNSVHDNESEKEINYALTLFGENQKQLILDHFNKVAPLAGEPIQPPEYHGECLCLITPESAAAGATEWWTARCPVLRVQHIDSTHHALLDGSRIRAVGRLVNEHCCQIAGNLGPITP
ncbi:hypothetical protein ANOM_009909 [Aspergillus nomiae NRRL 13137]|uniref:ABC multidrug transporter MDR2 n=1 Tax=Aspergillus nomiae NRRL (strain ATCC 15546 / NRRL 13137 / CBS 260.88 / M93) TaxID=1509407 RepID=A0A0L1IU31_ASPN3|nr:uncharacterized protein ANOM_009909 [Aspergillus nomiae NRRL 13137]KNG82703.1 hypothetical protein ANOM_009909 [Aspergillus nomiae NRRL 13137]